MSAWRLKVQTEAGNDTDAARPIWSSEVPFCDDGCPHYDGKRCRVLGLRPDNICEPVVQQMAALLNKAAL